jgi:hypothetical protein
LLLEIVAGLMRMKKGGGRLSSPAAPYSHGSLARRYLPQHPEPQHPARSAFTPAVGHSSTQQTQVQCLHSQLPVSQQPQHSHWSQPAFWPLMVAGTKASAAKRIRLFMGKTPVDGNTESITPRHDV